ncbi:hypothetical protein DLM76_14370 [Leptospira yasudae]|uniref:ABM domain-containing protein n=1 Tax=Leptospira yasudae TaxID=2202201 RepID=A0ABX9M3J6_9LEPT|nr:hypothetical protein DLM77_15040 [Leptospira yasudae]RHX93619.1 hypothetical protein DLM76_14370 [Leptospira yasudae]TGK24928.1 hypothetical protein EHQ05_17190 [Leptospira yasudae]TGM09511.1 hypothetical protein EHQ86_02285 [Leptospira yasudae]
MGTLLVSPTIVFAEKAYLEITLKVDASDRSAAGEVYEKFRKPFLKQIAGAKSKELLLRDEDVQVLHVFANRKQAEAYLTSELFAKDIVSALKPLLKANPEIRIYSAP